MDGGCSGGSCGSGGCGGGSSKRSGGFGGGGSGGGSGEFSHTMRMAMVVSGLTGAFLLAAANATQAMALWAAGLLFLNHAATHGLNALPPESGAGWRGRLSLAQGLALAAGAAAVVAASAHAIATIAVPDAPPASLALLLALAVAVVSATLLFAGRRGAKPTARSIWLCARLDVAPLAAGLIGLGASRLLDDGWPDALAGALVAAMLLPAAWTQARNGLSLGGASGALRR